MISNGRGEKPIFLSRAASTLFLFLSSFFQLLPYASRLPRASASVRELWYYPSTSDVSCDRRRRPRLPSNTRNAHLSILSADQMDSCRFINIASRSVAFLSPERNRSSALSFCRALEILFINLSRFTSRSLTPTRHKTDERHDVRGRFEIHF